MAAPRLRAGAIVGRQLPLDGRGLEVELDEEFEFQYEDEPYTIAYSMFSDGCVRGIVKKDGQPVMGKHGRPIPVNLDNSATNESLKTKRSLLVASAEEQLNALRP